MYTHGFDRGLLRACDHEIGQRSALELCRADEEVLLLAAETRLKALCPGEPAPSIRIRPDHKGPPASCSSFFNVRQSAVHVNQCSFPGGAGSATIIDTGVTFKGEIRGDGPLTVRGRFEGDIVLDGIVHVGAEGEVDANVDARAIVIAGVVRGNLSAHTKVDVLDSGAFTGTVRSGAFSAADGARVKGDVWIEQAAAGESPA